jgi:hypothetical protein
MELVIQLALDESPLAPVYLCGREKFAVNVGVNSQEVSYLIRPAKWGNNERDR